MLLFATPLMAWVKEMENPGLYQGDMELDPDQLQAVRNGKFSFGSTKNSEKIWPRDENGEVTIPYYIESSLGRERQAVDEIKASIEQYHKYTCLRFVPWRRGQNYISFYKGQGCSSPVGRNNGRGNRISLSSGCWWRATIMHEMGHSLGLHHEQSRPDRDRYVQIMTHNIHSGTLFNFKKKSYSEVDSLGSPYDYLSMMHYSWNAFAIDRKQPSIKTADPRYQYLIGQDNGFSQTDIDQLNKLYKCDGTYPTLPPFQFPPKGCYDTGGACGKGKHEGQCTDRRWQTYMRRECRWTCRFCGGEGGKPDTGKPLTFPPVTTDSQPRTTQGPKPTPTNPTGICRDRVIDCRFHGKHRCNGSSSSWRKFMARSCRKYCGFCN